MLYPTLSINCLFSHKCGELAHSIGKQLFSLLAPFEITLQIDPFNVGDDAEVRMQTFSIEAVIFLCEPLSLVSKPCQLELKAASRQGLPIFTLHLEGDVPQLFKRRSYWHVPPLDSDDFAIGTAKLAMALKQRVLFNRSVRLLHPGNYFYETSEIARGIAMEEDRTILAEFACELAIRYRRITDPSTRYWIAVALGKADTPHVAKLLDKLPSPSHPLELEGIRQAHEMLQHTKTPIPNPSSWRN